MERKTDQVDKLIKAASEQPGSDTRISTVQSKEKIEVIIQPPQQSIIHDISQFIPFLSIFVIILGWHVVSRQNDKRERRKEIREQISELKKRIEKIQTLALSYYSLDGKDKKAEPIALQIKIEIHFVSRNIILIRKSGLKLEVDQSMSAFRQSVTGGQFETVGRVKCDQDALKINDLMLDGGSLIEAVESAYFSATKIRLR